MTMSWHLGRCDHWQIDPNPLLLDLSSIHIRITWYGALFALGLIISYQLFGKLWQRRAAAVCAEAQQPGLAAMWQERLFTWIYLSILLGARLGEVFFYEWPYYRAHLWEIPKIWRGGLSSHGAMAGMVIAVCSFARFHSSNRSFGSLKITALEIFDLLALSATPCMACIRFGNFLNQEILGTPSNRYWAVVFLTPKDGSISTARHPVQLYEAIAYLMIGLALWQIPKSMIEKRPGLLFGIFLLSVFLARIALEYFKAPLAVEGDHCILSRGQILSLPALAMGFWLIASKARAAK